MALGRTAVGKANSESPSVGDPPQSPTTLAQGSPSEIVAAKGRSSLGQPPSNHRTTSLLCTLKTKASYLHRPPETKKNRGRTPKRKLPNSPLTPE